MFVIKMDDCVHTMKRKRNEREALEIKRFQKKKKKIMVLLLQIS